MKNIIILGRPRAGKSTLANMIADKYNYQIIRTDTIRGSFKDVFPELNIKAYTAIDSKEFQLFCKTYLERNMRQPRNKYNYVMEGCEMHVKDCKELYDNGDNLIYCLAQIDIAPEEMAKNMKNSDTDKDWTNEMSDKERLEYCKRSIEKARVIKEECEIYGLKFYDTAKNREKVLEEIMQDIEKNIN